MTSENETWAQTLITVTPEDHATIREVSDETTLSSTSDTHLVLNPENIVYRRSFTDRQFVDASETINETEAEVDTQRQDAEIQTYLEGIQNVRISVEYRDESSQTMYMSSPCPPIKYFKDIMTSMNEGPMPTIKRSNATATIINFHPTTSEDAVIEQLSVGVTEEELEDFVSQFSATEETEVEVTGILYFVIARALWIRDPTILAETEMSDKATQTCIIYNNRTKTFIIDRQTQTELTCEPKQSHSKLLTDYWETKNMVLDYLQNCISKAIDVRIIIDDIVDEIIDKCAERFRYPMKEQVAQTITTYRLRGEREEDVLRKLRLDIIVDPFEASIVVVPMMNDLLQLACDVVSSDAVYVSGIVLNGLLQRVSIIITKLMELQKQSERKPIDKILAKRKEKILELMSKKETETISTQTSIAAIAEVKKIKKSQEVLCSVCRRQSMCQWCLDHGEADTAFEQDVQILRTQDILLAYKPCYIVTKATEKNKLLLQPPCSEKKVKSPSERKVKSIVNSCEEFSDTICICTQDGKEVKAQESFNEWSYVTDATLMKPCSFKESVSSLSQTTMTLLDQSICTGSVTHRSDALNCEAVNALQILKQTFCNRENCATSSMHTFKKDSPLMENDKTENICACLSQCSTNNKMCGQDIVHIHRNKVFSKLHLSKTNTYSRSTSSRRKSYTDCFKIAPVCVCQNSNV